MPETRPHLASVFACALALAVAAAAVVGVPGQLRAAGDETVVIEFRLWQGVRDVDNLWVSARPQRGSWSAFGTVRLTLVGPSSDDADELGDRHGQITIAEVGLRVWQPAGQSGRFSVEACASLSVPSGGRMSGCGAAPWV